MRMRFILRMPVLICLTAAALVPRESWAQGTARSMDFDLSVRGSGMGGASNAVFWGGGISHWGNPALLAHVRGVRYEWTRTQLVPGLSDNVFLASNLLKLGVGGAGFVSSGTPFGRGVDLDYGPTQGTDVNGQPTGFFNSYERVDSWGFGVSALQTFESLMSLGGWTGARPSRLGDVSFGMNFKDVAVNFGPFPGAQGSTSAKDVGVLVRLTPIDLLHRRRGVPVRVDLSYGWSVLSYNDDATITFLNPDQASPVTRHRRNGAALRLGMNLPRSGSSQTPGGIPSWLVEGLEPHLAIGVGVDWSSIGAGDRVDYRNSGEGLEVGVANALFLRVGHYEDKVGQVIGTTWGWGMALPLGRVGGVLYEESRFPQARNSQLEDVRRRAFSAWIDPVEIWFRQRKGRSSDHGEMAFRGSGSSRLSPP